MNGAYNTITKPCAGCGVPVSKAASLIERRNGNVYCAGCSQLCRRGRRGFDVGYPKEFDSKLRKAIRQRDKFTCQVCGEHQKQAGTLHVHHIDYDKFNNERSNLIALCRVCHGKTNYGTDAWQRDLSAFMEARRHP